VSNARYYVVNFPALTQRTPVERHAEIIDTKTHSASIKPPVANQLLAVAYMNQLAVQYITVFLCLAVLGLVAEFCFWECGLQGSYKPWKVLESPEIEMLRFSGLESPGKRHRSWKTLEKFWSTKVMVLKTLLSGSSIAP